MAQQQAPTPRLLEPTPRVTNLHAPTAPSLRVPNAQPAGATSTTAGPEMPSCRPRQHQPAIISQEKQAYNLLATPLPRIETSYAVTDHLAGQQLEYRHLLKRPYLRPIWEMAVTNEVYHLAQGIRDIKGTDTIQFIRVEQVPQGRQITYGRLVCDTRPQKAEHHRVRLIVGGGDRIDYPVGPQRKTPTSPR
jgi:hypothetical protein